MTNQDSPDGERPELEPIATKLVHWGEIFFILRMACPKLGMYGDDNLGDAERVIELLNDKAFIGRVAAEIFAINSRYRAQTAAADQVIAAAADERRRANHRLVDMIAKHKPAGAGGAA